MQICSWYLCVRLGWGFLGLHISKIVYSVVGAILRTAVSLWLEYTPITSQVKNIYNTMLLSPMTITQQTLYLKKKRNWGKLTSESILYTANEGPVRIQYICLVPIYVFPEMKLLFSKQNYNVLSPSTYTHISVRDFYIILGSACLFCCRKICVPIMGIYRALTDTWMWKLGLMPRNSQNRNTYMGYSLQCRSKRFQ